jgi:hypothetical protein
MGYPNQTCDVSKSFKHIQTIHIEIKRNNKHYLSQYVMSSNGFPF